MSGTGKVFGTVRIVDSIPVSDARLKTGFQKHQIPDLSIVNYKNPHAWVLQGANWFDEPVEYERKPGAVIWLNDDEIDMKIRPRCYKGNGEAYPLCVGDYQLREDVCSKCGLYEDMEEE